MAGASEGFSLATSCGLIETAKPYGSLSGAQIGRRLRLTGSDTKCPTGCGQCQRWDRSEGSRGSQRKHTLWLYGSSSFIGRRAVSIGSRLIRSYSAITCAPTNKTIAPISTLKSTAIAVVREP